jgi:hypothetical protein
LVCAIPYATTIKLPKPKGTTDGRRSNEYTFENQLSRLMPTSLRRSVVHPTRPVTRLAQIPFRVAESADIHTQATRYQAVSLQWLQIHRSITRRDNENSNLM